MSDRKEDEARRSGFKSWWCKAEQAAVHYSEYLMLAEIWYGTVWRFGTDAPLPLLVDGL